MIYEKKLTLIYMRLLFKLIFIYKKKKQKITIKNKIASLRGRIWLMEVSHTLFEMSPDLWKFSAIS